MKKSLLTLLLIVVFAAPAAAGARNAECTYCLPTKKYDSQEVIRTTKDIDRSRVINTVTVLPTRRVIERNHLVIRKN